MSERFSLLGWLSAIAIAIIGVIAIGFRYTPLGWWLFAVGGGVLAALAFRSAWSATRADVARPAGGVFVLGAGAGLFYIALVSGSSTVIGEIPLIARVALLVTGVQAFFHAVSVRITGIPFTVRVVVPAAGHLLLFTASGVVIGIVFFGLPWLLVTGVLLAYATGISALTLHVFWLGQRADTVVPPRPFTVHRYWEQALIGALVVGILSVGVISVSIQANALVELVPTVTQARIASIVAGIAAVAAIATLAAPEIPPPLLERFTGRFSTILQHSLLTLLVLNALVFAFLLWMPAAYLWILGGYLVLLVAGVLVEYWMVGHAHRQRRQYQSATTHPPLEEFPPVTVVVNAFNEAEILPDSLDHNLAALDDLPFVLVPAVKSTDGTVELAYEYAADYPDRIRIVEGTAGSKAGDLNLVWETIDTPYVLILDADETVDASFVARGLALLEDSPSVGIVQGRKVEQYPDRNGLARFASAERRHNTWIDHPFWHDLFGASHFAGSAAVLRHEVPLAVGGWSEETLTEDIDLTLRLYLQTDWRVEYVPELTARILNPKTFRALVRQRRRWARGWVTAMAEHGVALLRSGPKLGWTRSLSLLWVLFTTVNAPLYTVFPAIMLIWLLGLGADLPIALVVGLIILIFPAKAISYGYASLRDPAIPVSANPIRVLEVVAHAYLWIPATWLIQLHSLYLQLAGAPKIWEGTEKAARPIADAPPERVSDGLEVQ